MDFDLPSRASSRWCSRGSPGSWFWNLSSCHLKIPKEAIFCFMRVLDPYAKSGNWVTFYTVLCINLLCCYLFIYLTLYLRSIYLFVNLSIYQSFCFFVSSLPPWKTRFKLKNIFRSSKKNFSFVRCKLELKHIFAFLFVIVNRFNYSNSGLSEGRINPGNSYEVTPIS